MRKKSESFFAFVLMPFSESFRDIYKFGIRDTATELDIRAERVDEQIYAEGMLERIYNQIDAADIIIADMSERNANVFYEVGYAHGQRKLCILLTQDAESIPFDLKHHRHIVYEGSIENLRSQLEPTLTWAKGEISKSRSSKINVDLKTCFGSLDRNQYRAKGTVHLKFELSNPTNQPSPEIEQVLLYTRKGWTLYQDGKECPKSGSDLPDYGLCHSLAMNPAVRKLATRNSWAQVKCEAKRLLASASQGDELRDSYHLCGDAIVRLVTSKGNYDYRHTIDVEMDEIPF